MDAERWREIERVYHLAREQAAERRAAFLQQARGGDEEYLHAGVREAAAQACEQPGAAAMIGQTVSHYRVVEKLGSGGTGVVYRAEDLRLRRDVALRVLTDNLAGEPLAVERFEREAGAATAISLPGLWAVWWPHLRGAY